MPDTNALTDDERAELEALRAEKAKRERARAAAAERAELEAAYEAAPKSSDGRVLSEDGRERDPRVAAAEMEFGDLLFALVNVARKMGIDAEAALRASNAKFRRRFAQIERAAWEQGRNVEDLSLDEMEACWQQAKEEE